MSKRRENETREAAVVTTATPGAGHGVLGCSPGSLNSPMSSCGSRASFESSSLEKFMEAWGALSPEAQQLAEKRQSLDHENAPSGAYSRDSNSSPSGRNAWPISGSGETNNGSNGITPAASSNRHFPSAAGFQTPRAGYGFGDFMQPIVRRNSPGMLDPSASIMADSSGFAGGREQRGVPRVASGSLSRSPKRKRSYGQLTPCGDENGAPSPFPCDGGSKSTSQVLSNSRLTVQNDGAYLQVTFDESHRFAVDAEEPAINPWGESLMNDTFLSTPEQPSGGQRKDIDQALSLLQLSGGSGVVIGGVSRSEFTRPSSRRSSGQGSGGKEESPPNLVSSMFLPVKSELELAENIVPGSTTAAPALSAAPPQAPATKSAYSSYPTGDILERNPWFVPESRSSIGVSSSILSPLPYPASADAQDLLGPPPQEERSVTADESTNNSANSRVGRRPATRKRVEGDSFAAAAAKAAEVADGMKYAPKRRGRKAKGEGNGADNEAFCVQGTGASTRSKKGKLKAKGIVGGQRPAVQALVSTPRGAKGGGPGSFCSKPEALSQLDTSQGDLMVLDADLWIVRERGDGCTSEDCIYRDKRTGISSRRHYHATCDHRHKGGPKGGMIFHHHQLEKIQKHQRAHIRTLHKKTPAEAVLSEANVEPYLPSQWTDHETNVLEHLVGLYGSSNWNIIAAGVATKSEIQCMLHWRFALNGNATVKGTGTWQPVEDERMLALVQLFGQRWSTVAEHMPGRLAKQCRERYLNNLDPELRRGTWSREEDEKLLQLRGQQNKSFAKIAEQIEGRSYNDVKNRWSQISRQIAALKKTSGGKKQGGSSPKGLSALSAGIREIREIASASSATASTNVPSKQNADDAGNQGQDYDLDKIDFGGWRRTAIGEGSGSTPKSDSSDGNRATGALRVGGGDKFSRYKVCMRGGVPTLQEAKPRKGGGEGYDVGDGGQSSVVSVPAATGGRPGESVSCDPSDAGNNRERTRNRSSSSSGSSSDSGSPEIASHGMFMGVEGESGGVGEARNDRRVEKEAKTGGAGVATSAGLVGPMTDAEANSIAGGALFGFGNDFRVSI